MRTLEINLYRFDELSDEAKEKAIKDAIEFLNSEPTEYENENGEIVYEYFEHGESQAEQFIDVNDYMFFKDGTLAHTVTYCGKHPKAGQSEFFLHGEIVNF